MSDFTHLIDLASARLGGKVVVANDDFFAEKENLLKPEAPISVPDKYTDRGKWMDGWETRRRRTPGHDWCIVSLGLPGAIHSLVVDTAFFRGNFPSHCSVDACSLPADADPAADTVGWQPLLDRTELAGDTRNTFAVEEAGRFTHVRLNIFPDGGVARFRVMGEAQPDWTRILGVQEEIDLAALVHGGYIVDTSDRFFGEPRNMLMPDAAPNTGDGWETRRRRDFGHDWAVIRLGIPSVIRRIEIDTAHFKGNYPDTASVEAAVMGAEDGGVSADVSTRAIADWKTVLVQTELEPDHLHVYERELVADVVATHVRLNIFPDGGVSRFRVFGVPLPEARRRVVLGILNTMSDAEARVVLADISGAPGWIDTMAAARPFASPEALMATSDSAASALSPDDWREAFRHHPRVGEKTAERPQSGAARQASSREQSGVQQATAEERAALADANREYEKRFGHVFIVSAAGKSAAEMLALLQKRMDNDPETELRIAAEEQTKISRLRLARLVE